MFQELVAQLRVKELVTKFKSSSRHRPPETSFLKAELAEGRKSLFICPAIVKMKLKIMACQGSKVFPKQF